MGRVRKKQKGLQNQKKQQDASTYSKRMMQGLIFSVALNFALLSTVIFNGVKKSSSSKAGQTTYIAKGIQDSSTLEQTILKYSDKHFADLIGLLQSDAHIEEGFSQRDIALSVLSHQFDLDVDRALLGQMPSIRHIPIQRSVGNPYQYPLLSGLSESQYHLISTFIKSEQWPLTSEGLFKKLIQGVNDESLKSAFYLTKEFMYVEGLFCSLSISKDVLLSTILQGTWQNLSAFINDHHQVNDFSNALRIQFLSQYLEAGSEYAARLILEIDPTYALKKLSDTEIVALLGLLEKKSSLYENFAIHLAMGQRSDWVRREACRLLYQYSNLELPEPYDYNQALGFLSQKYHIDSSIALVAAEPEAPSSVKHVISDARVYVVQEGDNLWKIAKKNQVSLDELKKVNHLDSDLIKVGMTLVLP